MKGLTFLRHSVIHQNATPWRCHEFTSSRDESKAVSGGCRVKTLRSSHSTWTWTAIVYTHPGWQQLKVSPFFSRKKLTTFLVIAIWQVMTFSELSSPRHSHLPHVVYTVFFINSATKINCIRVSPSGWCHPGRTVPPVTPLTMTLRCLKGWYSFYEHYRTEDRTLSRLRYSLSSKSLIIF